MHRLDSLVLTNHHSLLNFLPISLYFIVAHYRNHSLTLALTVIFNLQSQLAPILQLLAVILIKVEVARSQCSLNTNIHHHLAILNCALHLLAYILNALTHIVMPLSLSLIL